MSSIGNIAWRAYRAEGIPAASSVDVGDQFCNWSDSIDIVVVVDGIVVEVVDSKSEAATYIASHNPPTQSQSHLHQLFCQYHASFVRLGVYKSSR